MTSEKSHFRRKHNNKKFTRNNSFKTFMTLHFVLCQVEASKNIVKIFPSYKVIEKCIHFDWLCSLFGLTSNDCRLKKRRKKSLNLKMCCYYLNKINIQFRCFPKEKSIQQRMKAETKFHIGPGEENRKNSKKQIKSQSPLSLFLGCVLLLVLFIEFSFFSPSPLLTEKSFFYFSWVSSLL